MTCLYIDRDHSADCQRARSPGQLYGVTTGKTTDKTVSRRSSLVPHCDVSGADCVVWHCIGVGSCRPSSRIHIKRTDVCFLDGPPDGIVHGLVLKGGQTEA